MNMNKIYKRIAKQNGVSASDVKRDIQASIDEAYKNPSFYARCVHYKGDKPTPEEFITYLANRIKSSGD